MSKIAVVYWSSTGNTEAMAVAVAEGAKKTGAEVTLTKCTGFDPSAAAEFDAIAFGCPAMGDEQLETEEFAPVFEACLPALSGKKIALFGSFGWGEREWMEKWSAQCADGGAVLVADPVTAQEAPDDEALAACVALGEAL